MVFCFVISCYSALIGCLVRVLFCGCDLSLVSAFSFSAALAFHVMTTWAFLCPFVQSVVSFKELFGGRNINCSSKYNV